MGKPFFCLQEENIKVQGWKLLKHAVLICRVISSPPIPMIHILFFSILMKIMLRLGWFLMLVDLMDTTFVRFTCLSAIMLTWVCPAVHFGQQQTSVPRTPPTMALSSLGVRRSRRVVSHTVPTSGAKAQPILSRSIALTANMDIVALPTVCQSYCRRTMPPQQTGAMDGRCQAWNSGWN